MKTTLRPMILTFAVALSSCALAQTPGEIESGFKQAIEARQSMIDTNKSIAPLQVTLVLERGEMRYGHRVWDKQTYEIAKLFLPSWDKPLDPAYRDALIAELSSGNPEYRGLACELLGLAFDLKSIQRLGGMLDDNVQAGPTLIYDWPQSGPGSMYSCSPIVAQLAAAALTRITGVSFDSRAAFDTWWKHSGDHTRRIWYWGAKWRCWSSHEGPFILPKPGQPEPAPDFTVPVNQGLSRHCVSELEQISPKDGLKILLLLANLDAFDAEVTQLSGSKGCRARPEYSEERFADQAPVDFIRRHNLRPRLLDLLQQNNLYPEITSDDAFDGLCQRICALGRAVFTADDEKAFAAAQEVNHPFKPPIQRFLLIRANLAPDRAKAILTTALRGDPKLSMVAGEVARRYGSEERESLTKAFAAGGDSIAFELRNAASQKVPVSLSFIAELAKMLGKPDMESSRTLITLAETANIAAGRDVISKAEIHTISKGRRKARDLTEPAAAAYERVRQKLMLAR